MYGMGNGGFGGGYQNPGFGIPQGSGYQFNGGNQNNMMGQKIDNILSQDEIMRLKQKENQFSLNISEVDRLRGICNHRDESGMRDAIVEDNDGLCRCTICGYTFKPIDQTTDQETLKEAVDTILDILQTIKLLYLNIPHQAASEYFQIIPLIEKIPMLFDYAVKDYSRFANYNPYSYNDRNMGTMNLFGMLSSYMNNGAMQPNMQPNMGMQQQPYGYQANGAYNSNGFGYYGQQPMGMQQPYGYQAQTNGYQYNPNVQPSNPAQMPTQQQPADGGQPTPPVAEEVNVTQTFKA